MTDNPNLIPSYTPFPDPVSDKLLGVVLALAAEVWVLKDRIQLMEAVLEAELPLGDLSVVLDRAAHGVESRESREASLNEFVARICSVLDE